MTKALHILTLMLTLLITGCASKKEPLTEEELNASIRKSISQAEQAIEQKETAEAVRILENLQEQYPDNVNVLEAMAFAYSDMGDNSLAAFYFEHIARLDEEMQEAYIFAAQSHETQKNWSEACKNYISYLESFPNDSKAWQALSKAYENNNQPMKAESALQKYQQLSHSLQDEGNHKEPSSPQQTQENLSLAQESSQLDEPITVMEEQASEQKTELLSSEVEESKELAEASGEILTPTLADEPLLATFSEPESALKTELSPTSKDHIRSARELKKSDHWTQAIEEYWKALTINPTPAHYWQELSDVYYKNHDYNNAEMTALEAIRRDPSSSKYALNYLRVVQSNRSAEQIMNELQSAKARFPNNPEITLALARGYEQIEGNRRNAYHLYQEFLQQAPSNHSKRQEVQQIVSSLR